MDKMGASRTIACSWGGGAVGWMYLGTSVNGYLAKEAGADPNRTGKDR